MAIPKAVAVFNVVACPATPIAHFTIVLAPGVYGAVANGDLSPLSSLALEIGGLVHVAIDAMADAGNSVGGG